MTAPAAPTHFWFPTRQGLASIRYRQTVHGAYAWALSFDEELLGFYARADTAAAEIATGGCSWPSFGDTSELGIPEELREWKSARTA